MDYIIYFTSSNPINTNSCMNAESIYVNEPIGGEIAISNLDYLII